MKKRLTPGLDFRIDKLTNSIENDQSGDSFPTDISLFTSPELKTVTKKNGWRFNWGVEFKQPVRDVYKLSIANNPNIIQGVISLEVRVDLMVINTEAALKLINKIFLKMYSYGTNKGAT